ncbi:eukaryotic translation initiation factor 4G [Actinidia rufa]|uniref:Eukaryotic translation initiation factor 4G n=1 Tax=Actinidia rufa TaxID=165716 RepID=A0A7J0EXQ8_9ERIC|nr:eukaryotic translation initiation factor 4G [Actinidia rufa]
MPPLIIPSSTSLYIHPSNRPQPAATSPILSPASPTNPLPSPPPPSAILVTTPPPTSSSPLPPVAPFFFSLYVDRIQKNLKILRLDLVKKNHKLGPDSSRAVPTFPISSVPKQQILRMDGGAGNQSNTGVANQICRFEIASDIADLMASNVNVSREPHPSPGRIIDRQPVDYQPDRRGSGMGDDDKWSKSPGPLASGWDPRMDNYGGNFRPGQGGNYGVLRNPRAQAPTQCAGGILSGPMRSLGSQRGIQWNTPDSERWQRATTFQKGLIPSPQTPLQIFDKALMEPTFCEMYANLCYRLARELPDFSEDNKKITFKRVLLNKCQEEFERGEREQQEADRADQEGEVKQSEEQREEKRLQARRRRMLGNIRLIGELYKNGMLTERIMHESQLERLLTIPKPRNTLIHIFDMMARLSNNMKLSSGVRFMLKDAIDLRKNKWQQRRKVEGPKKIKEVHRDAGQERQVQAGRLTLGQTLWFWAIRISAWKIRHSFENRTLSVTLPQRAVGEGSNTLGPQGGLAKGMSIIGQPSILNTSVSERMVYGREDLMPSAKDEKEVAQCVKDLNSPGYYPTMISIWVTDSFERKDMERDLLAKLLINLSKSREGMFESVLATLEDAVNDAPKAGEISRSTPCQSGEEHGSLVESGLAAEVVGTILETIKSEKGDSVVNEIRASSSLKLEKFRHPDPKRSGRLDKFI